MLRCARATFISRVHLQVPIQVRRSLLIVYLCADLETVCSVPPYIPMPVARTSSSSVRYGCYTRRSEDPPGLAVYRTRDTCGRRRALPPTSTIDSPVPVLAHVDGSAQAECAPFVQRKKNTCFCGNHALNMTIAIYLARLDEKVHKCIAHDSVQRRAGAFRISNMKPTASASRIKSDCSCPYRHIHSIYLLKMEISESGESLWA